MDAAGEIGPGGPGIVYLVGAGPGDPLLLTRRGLEVLRAAEVVVYDHLGTPRLLVEAPPGATLIAAGKSIGHKTMSQEEINATLAEHARAGRRVVRLKGGDPYVFGRGAEEAEHLHALGIPFEVVPGVTSGLGATAAAGIAVTHREAASAVAFVTGHDDPNNVGRLDWPALARFPGTLVIYMGVTRLRYLCETLVAGGKPADTPAALVEAGTTPRQRTVAGTLDTLPDRASAEKVGFPALLVVGEVVARRGPLNWSEARPLFGQRIVVTRPAEPDDDSARALERLGAEVLLAPLVALEPVADFAAIDRAIDGLATRDWLVFTSAHGVRHFLGRILDRGLDLRRLGGVRIAAIGPATAEALGRFHLRPDLVPGRFGSEALVASLVDRVRGGRVLLAQADRGRTTLSDDLGRVATVERLTVYRHVDADAIRAAVAARIEAGSVDWITATSPAIVRRLHALIPPPARGRIGTAIRLASISPLTTAAAKELGWPVAAEAEAATWDGVVAAIRQAVRVEG